MCFKIFIHISDPPEHHFWETIFPCGLRSWREAKVSEWAQKNIRGTNTNKNPEFVFMLTEQYSDPF